MPLPTRMSSDPGQGPLLHNRPRHPAPSSPCIYSRGPALGFLRNLLLPDGPTGLNHTPVVQGGVPEHLPYSLPTQMTEMGSFPSHTVVSRLALACPAWADWVCAPCGVEGGAHSQVACLSACRQLGDVFVGVGGPFSPCPQNPMAQPQVRPPCAPCVIRGFGDTHCPHV